MEKRKLQARKIEFRAWIQAQTDSYMVYQGEPDLETLSSFVFHYPDVELMQWTGLFDKNETKVFEGDLLAHRNFGHFLRVEYLSDGFCAIRQGLVTDVNSLRWVLNRGWFVCGNIYEGEIKKTKVV